MVFIQVILIDNPNEIICPKTNLTRYRYTDVSTIRRYSDTIYLVSIEFRCTPNTTLRGYQIFRESCVLTPQKGGNQRLCAVANTILSGNCKFGSFRDRHLSYLIFYGIKLFLMLTFLLFSLKIIEIQDVIGTVVLKFCKVIFISEDATINP